MGTAGIEMVQRASSGRYRGCHQGKACLRSSRGDSSRQSTPTWSHSHTCSPQGSSGKLETPTEARRFHLGIKLLQRSLQDNSDPLDRGQDRLRNLWHHLGLWSPQRNNSLPRTSTSRDRCLTRRTSGSIVQLGNSGRWRRPQLSRFLDHTVAASASPWDSNNLLGNGLPHSHPSRRSCSSRWTLMSRQGSRHRLHSRLPAR